MSRSDGSVFFPVLNERTPEDVVSLMNLRRQLLRGEIPFVPTPAADEDDEYIASNVPNLPLEVVSQILALNSALPHSNHPFVPAPITDREVILSHTLVCRAWRDLLSKAAVRFDNGTAELYFPPPPKSHHSELFTGFQTILESRRSSTPIKTVHLILTQLEWKECPEVNKEAFIQALERNQYRLAVRTFNQNVWRKFEIRAFTGLQTLSLQHIQLVCLPNSENEGKRSRTNPLDILLETLSGCTQLQHLYLERISAPQLSSSSEHVWALPALKSLRLSHVPSPLLKSFLSRLSYPGVQSLEITKGGNLGGDIVVPIDSLNKVLKFTAKNVQKTLIVTLCRPMVELTTLVIVGCSPPLEAFELHVTTTSPAFLPSLSDLVFRRCGTLDMRLLFRILPTRGFTYGGGGLSRFSLQDTKTWWTGELDSNDLDIYEEFSGALRMFFPVIELSHVDDEEISIWQEADNVVLLDTRVKKPVETSTLRSLVGRPDS